ncbi:hypothetical protein NX794_28625 [Streptomyces sp. LP11]|uniref:Uncharacterized protein n=1 Tax=Streptomyces pyxinicus TaxID=2970331 RepID=A0ABT2BAN1_9ACTN|nr:hypothetical protein [Streptomyces sp. LP11]MCS0605145.1 hypothetical protein [Streptomyces sp. LP11]
MREGYGVAPVDVFDLFDSRDPGAWLALDQAARSETYHRPPEIAGRSLSAALRDGVPIDDDRLALALCHHDGRIRQRALERAAGRPALLALVVVRCADWAEPVRDRARERLAEALDAESAVPLAPLILRLAGRREGDHALGLLGRVLRGASRERLAPLLTCADRAVRRYAHERAIEWGALSPAELARAAARDEDAVVQGRCADAALAGLPGRDAEGADEVLEALLGARNPRARAAGVTALRRLELPERAVGFLADRSAPVRACARYVLRQHGRDPLPWYRARCADPADPALPPGAAVGLGECGQRADAGLLWALLEHPVPGVRARAVSGLRALGVTDVPRMRRLLDDPAPGVAGEATLALLPSAGALPAEWLLERLDAARPRWQRVSAWRLLAAHGHAVRLRAARALLEDPDERLRERAGQVVARGC